MKKLFDIALILCLSLGLSACANYSGKQYPSGQVRSIQTVEYGHVTAVNPVTLEEDSPAIAGPLIGGLAGGFLGNLFGGGSGKTVATVGGALIGLGTGYATEKAVFKQNGLEIGIKLENGKEISIVQAADEQFHVGEKVRILHGANGVARVTR